MKLVDSLVLSVAVAVVADNVHSFPLLSSQFDS